MVEHDIKLVLNETTSETQEKQNMETESAIHAFYLKNQTDTY